MKKAIYYRLIALTLISISIYGLIAATVTTIRTQSQTENWLTTITLSTAELYHYNSDINLLSQVTGGHRVTIIAPNGDVIADSSVNYLTMANRADREEVRYATNDEVFTLIRRSYTLGQQFIYATIVTNDGHILRLAYDYPGFLYNLFLQLPAMALATATALILSVFLANMFTNTVVNPLEIVKKALLNRDYKQLREYCSPYHDVAEIMQEIERLLQQISKSRQSLQFEQEKVNHILSNMAEGFILVDNEEKILLCNQSVKTFFNVQTDVVGRDLQQLINDKNINVAVEKAFHKEQSSMFEMWLREELVLNVYISPTGKNAGKNRNLGATILLVDVTNEKQLEKQKREFFSNASHELKTPITSILGFSEMINQNIVKTEDEKVSIMRRIETEARRMTELINNVLMISNLEAKISTATQYTDFNLNEVLKEAINSISPLKDNKTIHFEVNSVDVPVHANKQQLYEICVNLIENAVKYNKPNGNVTIELKAKNHYAVLKVKDTGIGIPSEYQSRVFERFFRVDYGRNKKVGGSGLGLSIVKHIVNLYNGDISLKSKKDIGTTIQISLPIVRYSK